MSLGLAIRPEPWIKDAACSTSNPDIFFEEDTEEEAKAICSTCTVRDDCLEFAFRQRYFDEDTGIYGGLTPLERRRLRKKRQRRAVEERRAEQARNL